MSEQLRTVGPVSELELAALAAAAMPGMQIRQIRGALVNVDSGQWLRIVDAEGEQWLAWAPSSPIGGETMIRYMATLEVLAAASDRGDLPWAAPRIAGSVFREGGGEVFVMAYPGGAALAESDLNNGGLLPASVGTALAALHELPVGSYKSACRRYADADLTRKALRSLVKRHADAVPSRLRTRWLDALDEDSLWGFEPVPLHGCLSASDVYAADGAVVGMTRFDQAAVGDPAADLVWLMFYASDDFLNVFEESYAMSRTAPDLHLLTRAQLLSEIETLRWYARGFAADDRSWREQGLVALQDLDSDIGDQRLVPHRPDVVEITFGVEDEPLLKLQGSGSGNWSGPAASSGLASSGLSFSSGSFSSGQSPSASTHPGVGDSAGFSSSTGARNVVSAPQRPIRTGRAVSAEEATTILATPDQETGPFSPFDTDIPRGPRGGAADGEPQYSGPLRRGETHSIEIP